MRGVVQGVGFRPHVYRIATELALAGFVGNDAGGVFIEVEGPPETLESFCRRLATEAPPLAHIDEIVVAVEPAQGEAGFRIVMSAHNAAATTLVSPDLCLCEDCRRELLDPKNRRYLYPFINCTNCGPRFTIIGSTPYDRPATTMADFLMCPACQAEYDDPANRRFHAQPNACPVCGPRVEFRWSEDPTGSSFNELRARFDGECYGHTAIAACKAVLAAGGIVAIKGIGGFHLACDATNEAAVARLRLRKGRPHKPFAVMGADLESTAAIARLEPGVAELLSSRERPIVLVSKRSGGGLAPGVAPGTGNVGVMLPYAPLHWVLFYEQAGEVPAPRVLVMTSGNLSEEPIVYHDDDALTQLSTLVDAFLLHNRRIQVPCDDSVMGHMGAIEIPLRRSRGYAPFPVKLPVRVPPTLAVGGELKATFCLAAGRDAIMSQHVGDMENQATVAAFERSVAHFQRLFRIEPEILACDMHPGYHSRRWAEANQGSRPCVAVQHHHAHVAALMAENELDGSAPVIGFSFDGTGYGLDGAIWGGEILLCDYTGFKRLGHLRYAPLPGGDAAIRRPYRIALAQLWAAGIEWDSRLPAVTTCPPLERDVLRQQLEKGVQVAPTSSMGRLFDAVAALVGVVEIATYEGHAAMELEALAAAWGACEQPYAFTLHEGGEMMLVDPESVLKPLISDIMNGSPLGLIAARFHGAVTDLIAQAAAMIRRQTGVDCVALSGGVFQNLTLLSDATEKLQSNGVRTLVHRRVPANDGGIALGQAMIAAKTVHQPAMSTAVH
ncbi:MAG: carbamoyltransferase HypF [Anaerolineales bacterium]|nr:carbamoyltransferase HypF [Anaerolineales bacterium]